MADGPNTSTSCVTQGWLQDWEDSLDDRPGKSHIPNRTPPPILPRNVLQAYPVAFPYRRGQTIRTRTKRSCHSGTDRSIPETPLQSLATTGECGTELPRPALSLNAYSSTRVHLTGPRARRLAITRRGHPLRPDQVLSTGKRRLPSSEYRERGVAHRSHHGWVSGRVRALERFADDHQTDDKTTDFLQYPRTFGSRKDWDRLGGTCPERRGVEKVYPERQEVRKGSREQRVTVDGSS